MNEQIDLTLIVIPEDGEQAMAYTGTSMTSGVRVSLEVANAIVLQAKDDDKLARRRRKTNAYKSKKYFVHFELRYCNGYGRFLPADALNQIQERRQARQASRERTAVAEVV